jgi:cytidine deaminase
VQDWERLAEAATAASHHAYAPYSKFRVGAAVLSRDGRIFSGCNVENVSYGLTICAERSAVFHAVAKGMNSLSAIVVFTPTLKPTAPCGACRQVLHEFAGNVIVRCICNGPDILELPLTALLPSAFGPTDLN